MITTVKTQEYIDNPYGLLIPFTVIGRNDGDFDYEVYDTVLPLIGQELTARIDDYLTDGFYARINRALAGAVAELGYAPDPDLTHTFLLQYRAQGTCDCAHILDSTVRVDDIGRYTDLTETEFDTGDFPVFATVQGGRMVSVCGVNGMIDDMTAEIAVETIDSMRGRGFARSNVCAMVNYLVEQGIRVAYQCYPENTASALLAASCGLTLYSRDYHFVCYEKED